MKERIMGELKKVFRPELLNRIDEVIVFHKLTRDEILEIVDLLMRRVREQISTHEVVIELSDAAKELLVEKGYDPTMGARPLRRAIQKYIEDPLADFVLGSDLSPGVTILVDRKSDEHEEVSITLAGGGKREKVTVPATPEDAPEDGPDDEPAD
jgi:ATP-dependent Clp protease ATP-binding subunit ClpC